MKAANRSRASPILAQCFAGCFEILESACAKLCHASQTKPHISEAAPARLKQGRTSRYCQDIAMDMPQGLVDQSLDGLGGTA